MEFSCSLELFTPTLFQFFIQIQYFLVFLDRSPQNCYSPKNNFTFHFSYFRAKFPSPGVLFSAVGCRGSSERRPPKWFLETPHLGWKSSVDQNEYEIPPHFAGCKMELNLVLDFFLGEISRSPVSPGDRNIVGRILLAKSKMLDPHWAADGVPRWLDIYFVITCLLTDRSSSKRIFTTEL